MKIEIELSEIESLRADVSASKQKVLELESKLSELNENNLKRQAIRLSEFVFKKSIQMVFNKLGFKEQDYFSNRSTDFAEFERYLGVNWYNSEDITVDLGATITQEFSTAFLRMGIITRAEKEEKLNPLEIPE